MHVHALTYLPVGFGDHHWRADTATQPYFITVRDLRLDGRSDAAIAMLEHTFAAVRRLNHAAELDFIIAALPGASGAAVAPLGRDYALTVYDWLDVRTVPDPDGDVAASLVARLHEASRRHPVDAVHDDFSIRHRWACEAALRELDQPWLEGPFGEPARELLARHADEVRAALDAYDRFARGAAATTAGWCLTHGEPTGDNLVQDASGRAFLVDWESARVAPPERDLWQLADRANGRAPLLTMYRLLWDLAETSVYLLQFRSQHTADDNMVESWRNYQTFLPTRARWPDLLGAAAPEKHSTQEAEGS